MFSGFSRSAERTDTANHSYYKNFIAVIILTIVVILFFFIVKSRKQKLQQTANPQGFSNRLSLTEKEKDLIKLMANNTGENRFTSIDEINKILGLTNKNTVIQKKQRSDVINSINKKFSLLRVNTTGVIGKKRSDFDKRSFEYYIDSSCFTEIQKLL